mmetsp:Transcript_15629/g.23222  ORF Transcript_15629/g.23222 Transcript_15629/m.23222 type:complete len:308 (-) Transcript_15629:83-1006(-)
MMLPKRLQKRPTPKPERQMRKPERQKKKLLLKPKKQKKRPPLKRKRKLKRLLPRKRKLKNKHGERLKKRNSRKQLSVLNREKKRRRLHQHLLLFRLLHHLNLLPHHHHLLHPRLLNLAHLKFLFLISRFQNLRLHLSLLPSLICPRLKRLRLMFLKQRHLSLLFLLLLLTILTLLYHLNLLRLHHQYRSSHRKSEMIGQGKQRQLTRVCMMKQRNWKRRLKRQQIKQKKRRRLLKKQKTQHVRHVLVERFSASVHLESDTRYSPFSHWIVGIGGMFMKRKEQAMNNDKHASYAMILRGVFLNGVVSS